MDVVTASQLAVDLLTGTVVDRETGRDPPVLVDPIMRMRAAAFRSAFPDLNVTLQHVVADANWVAAHATGRAHHTGAFQGCPPTGRVWNAHCTTMFQVDQGRILAGWVTWDLFSILEQLGAVERSDGVSA